MNRRSPEVSGRNGLNGDQNFTMRGVERRDTVFDNANFIATSLDRALKELLDLVAFYASPDRSSSTSRIHAEELVKKIDSLCNTIKRLVGRYDRGGLGQYITDSSSPNSLKTRLERRRKVYEQDVKGKLSSIKRQILDRAID